MFSNIPDGQRLIMYGGSDAPRLDGVYLRHNDGMLLFTVEPTDPSGKERPELPKRYNITSYHLKGYYNKYVAKCDRDLWDMLLMGDGPQEATSLADMEKRELVRSPVSLLPAIPGLPAPLEAERKRILEQLEKWRVLTAAYETVKRLESRFAAHDEAALAKATAKEERYLQHRMMELTIARGGVKLSQERLAALKAKKEARAAELAAAKELIAALPI
jgi:hypothetical protein